ncbi:MAG: HYR domain-containing protein, partial [Saprospiraceae bacterium]
VICPADFKGCPQGIDPSVTGRGSALKGDKFCTTPTLKYIDDTLFFNACSVKVSRKWIATDTSNGKFATCLQDIELSDTQQPSITCPANITVKSEPDCKATVQWAQPQVSDNCSRVTLVSSHPSGSRFDVGTTTVFYTASDACGNTKGCQFTITVESNCCDKPPVVICPADFKGCPQGIDPSVTGRGSALKGNKFCTTPTIKYIDDTLIFKPCSLKVSRKWIATDTSNGKFASCIQNIELKDTLEPSIGVINDIVVASDIDCFATVNWNPPTTSDNCSNVSLVSSHLNGSRFPIGVTKVTYTAIDNCNNKSTKSFNITVTDNCCDLPPIIICPTNFIACPNSSTLPSITGSPTVNPGSSRCRNPIVSYTDEITKVNSCSTYIKRTWLAIDSIKPNLKSSCIQVIELKDTIKPIVICPKDIEVKSNENCVAIVEWEVKTSDNCGTITVSSSHESGAEFTIGTRTIYYSVFDACGNSSGCNFNVTVLDNCCNRPPHIICPANIVDCPGSIEPIRLGFPTVIKGNLGCNEPLVSYKDFILVNKPCSIRVNRTWLAVDPNNSSFRDSCVQTIELIDINPPVFKNCPQDFTVNPNYNCEAFPTWTEPTADDACRLVSLVRSHGPNTRFLTGITKVTYTATDACGNTSNCSFNITVTNECCNKPPVLTCPSDYKSCPSTSIDPSLTGNATVALGTPYCVPAIVTFTDKILSSGPCVGAKVIERTWLAIDPNNANLFATCKQKITLSDTTKPIIIGTPSNIIIDAKGKCQIPVSWIPPTATDNCNLVSLIGSKTSGSLFNGGVTTILYTATDGCGNSTTSSFKINVLGTEIQIDCPNDTVVYRTNTSAKGVIVNWDLPKAKYCGSCLDSMPGFIYMGEYAGNRYFCSLSPARWSDAKINCILNGGKLAVIRNKEENSFISSKLMNQVAWIGGTDENREGSFEWVDGSPFIFSNWASGHPNSINPLNDYVELSPDGTWSDLPGNISKEFICQMPCYVLKQISGPSNGTLIPCGNNKISYAASKDGISDTCSFTVKVDCDSISKYCYNKALNTDVMWIDHVTISNIDNVSGDNGGYAYFGQPCGNLKNNQFYDVCVEPGFKNNLYTVYWKIWIDFNNDAFFQPNELVLLGSGNTGLCGKFMLPASYELGQVRMRVIMSYGAYASTACSSILYGEVEDYCLNLTRTGTIISSGTESFSPQPLNCTKDCNKKSEVLHIGQLNSRSSESILNIIPNPAKDEIRIQNISKTVNSLNIYNTNGKLVWRKLTPLTNQEILDVSQWSEGVYYILVDYTNENQSSHKIIIQR